jgi:hypothetical protein
MNKKYLCPVCGFLGLKEPAFNQQNIPSYEICPCCGFEFGFDGNNNQETFAAFRKRWLEKGGQWFMESLKPKDWDMQKQLDNLKKK